MVFGTGKGLESCLARIAALLVCAVSLLPRPAWGERGIWLTETPRGATTYEVGIRNGGDDWQALEPIDASVCEDYCEVALPELAPGVYRVRVRGCRSVAVPPEIGLPETEAIHCSEWTESLDSLKIGPAPIVVVLP